jgi:hypothetical protein
LVSSFKNEFIPKRFFNFSIAMLFAKKSSSNKMQNYGLDILIANRNIYLIYLEEDDWFFKSVCSLLLKNGYKFNTMKFNTALSHEEANAAYVFGWNYFKNSYFPYTKQFSQEKLVLLWQMLVKDQLK